MHAVIEQEASIIVALHSQFSMKDFPTEEDVVSMISYAKTKAKDYDSNSSNSRYWPPNKLRKIQDTSTTMTSPSRFKGVVMLHNGNWGAQIYSNHQRIWLGTFKSDKDAAMAYDSAAIKLRSEDLHRNFPWNSLSAQEPIFQSHLTTVAVLNMIKDGTYRLRFKDYLRNQFYNASDKVELSLAPTRHANDANKEGVSSCQQLFQKELTLSDVGKLNRLVIPKKYAVRHFPQLSEGQDSTHLVIFDKQMKPWTFRYCYWKSSQSFVFTKGWNKFVKEKELKEKDVIAFYQCESKRAMKEGRPFLMIDKEVENKLNFAKEWEGMEIRKAAPEDNEGIRLFGVQIG
ncbi:AP2/ERF and B3 domain-containing transcription factor At1g50680-like [Malania oleifera]|uniref:AP2/ERF and B3 domain-containing transcription factor At1g50680-like n=1 Tax=Malania oleifera TaxID=397392 RepID=UPI0025AE7646|nr:AP2/ERF and B3 domain-containing transcription factor At1g50680-like [Malania oleifera]